MTNNTLVLFALWGTLSASVGAWVVTLAKFMWQTYEEAKIEQDVECGREVLYGVDVTGSDFLSRPAVVAAAAFAAAAHDGQMRMTKDPYIMHAVETAAIVEGLMASSAYAEDDDRVQLAVMAALLHDVVDDTTVELAELEGAFGPHVARLVQTVTQLSQMNQLMRRKHSKAAIRFQMQEAQKRSGGGTIVASLAAPAIAGGKSEEDELRNLILTMVDEPVAIVIKLADRLHNMRTVWALPPAKARAVATETLRVWCSLAERLGMFAVKAELEDLCFAVLQPEAYAQLRADVDQMWGLPSPSLPYPADTASPAQPSAASAQPSSNTGATEGSTQPFQGLPDPKMMQMPPTSSSASSPVAGGQKLTEKGAARAHSSAEEAGGQSSNSRRPADQKSKLHLNSEQKQVQQLIESVLPFDALMFKSHRAVAANSRRGLEVLEDCARALLQELRLEGYAPGMDVDVQGRIKSIYSMQRKMNRKGVPLAEVFDARALRFVVDDADGAELGAAIAVCYKLMLSVHRLWKPINGEYDDYIVNPKGSGYQSLHTAVLGPGGVPLEVQLRTSSMHETAEYGQAAHWAYKEFAPPVQQAPPGAASIQVGQPVLRVREGLLQDGVVVRIEASGLRLLCAIAVGGRLAGTTASGGPGYSAAYEELAALVDSKNWWQAGHGDLQACLESYTLCTDGKYHRIDGFGVKFPTVVIPLLQKRDEKVADTTSPIPPRRAAGKQSSPVEPDMRTPKSARSAAALTLEKEREVEIARKKRLAEVSLSNKTRLLRSVLEWGREIETEEGASAGEEQTSDVTVVMWPPGDLKQLPRGTTAGAVIKIYGLVDLVGESKRGALKSSGLVNVNNRLVPETTQLSDGDMVVLSRDLLTI